MVLEHPQDETRHHFTEILHEIQHGLVRMGSLVEENVLRAGSAMVEGRIGLVEMVRNADEPINEMYARLERQTFETLARQQPVAGDLRFLVATTRILYELERSGDLAVNCVKVLDRLHGLPEHPELNATLRQLVAATVKVFRMGIDAIADMTDDAGVVIEQADDEVDDLVSEYYTTIAQVSGDIGLDAGIGLSRIGRFLERIADHAVNIGENVQYIVTAEFPGDTHAALTDED